MSELEQARLELVKRLERENAKLKAQVAELQDKLARARLVEKP